MTILRRLIMLERTMFHTMMNCPASLLLIRFLDIIMAPNTMSCNRNQVTIPFCFQAQMMLCTSVASHRHAGLATLASLLHRDGILNAMLSATTSTLTAYTQQQHKHLLCSLSPELISCVRSLLTLTALEVPLMMVKTDLNQHGPPSSLVPT